MNILFVNTKGFWGGGEKLHFEYAEKFIELGHNVFIATKKDSPLYKKCNSKGIQTFAITLGNLAFSNPFKIRKLIQFYKKENIEIIIISNSPDLKAAGIAAKFAKVKRVVYLRGLAVPVKNNFLNRYFFKNILSHIVPNSLETKRTTLKNFNKVKISSKIKVIYHGIDIEEYDRNVTIKNQEERDYIILGNAGRLTEQKGQKHLIEVAKILKSDGIKFKLLIAGTGDLKNELQDLIIKNKLQNEVELLDFVDKIEDFMSSLDVFLLSSVWEGFGYVIVEAMAARKPVIAFNMSSNPEIIENNTTGYLVDYLDIQAFANKVKELSLNKELRDNLGHNGRKRLQNLFILDDRIKEFEEFITE